MEARFIPPMLLLSKPSLPDSSDWIYEIKLDGYRAVAFKSGGRLYLRSRNDNDFSLRYPSIAAALRSIPENTVLDGEVVAMDEQGRPSFNVLQNSASSVTSLFYYVFDVMILAGRDLMKEPLIVRRELLEKEILSELKDPIRYSSALPASYGELIESVKLYGLEGLVAKRRDSCYEPGKRSGAWQKMRINHRQEFVIAGYTLGGTTFDALIFGYYDGKDLVYVARTRNGFSPHIRSQLKKHFHGLEIDDCPFVNLPEQKSGRWGQGLTTEKMKECRWLKPEVVGLFEYLEWTPDNHLRHSRFVGLAEDRKAREVHREN
jgi:DNA ligase D-like protein (predicted ligase)